MYTLDARVRYSECDEQGNLSLLALVNYLQDCTTFHSESIGRGVEYMKERGIAWLIATWQIEIDRLPRFCDQITVGTWCHSMSRTLASRNFVIRDEAGNDLVRADSQWFIYDFVAGRPQRISDDQLVYLADEPPLPMPRTLRKIALPGEGTKAPQIVVGEQHLDSNRHVNNAQYLGMARSAIAATGGGLATSDLGRICVQYRRQAVLGDVIAPIVHADGTARVVSLADPEGDPFAIVRLERR